MNFKNFFMDKIFQHHLINTFRFSLFANCNRISRHCNLFFPSTMNSDLIFTRSYLSMLRKLIVTTCYPDPIEILCKQFSMHTHVFVYVYTTRIRYLHQLHGTTEVRTDRRSPPCVQQMTEWNRLTPFVTTRASRAAGAQVS